MLSFFFFFSYIIYCKRATDVPRSMCNEPGRELFLLVFFSSQCLYLAAALVEEAASPAGLGAPLSEQLLLLFFKDFFPEACVWFLV